MPISLVKSDREEEFGKEKAWGRRDVMLRGKEVSLNLEVVIAAAACERESMKRGDCYDFLFWRM